MHCYEYPRPSVTADILLFSYCTDVSQIQVLLIKRGHYPFEGMWALPGGFMDMDETIEQCANRELQEETNLQITEIEQLITASKLGRDPRGRTVSVIFWAFVELQQKAKAGDDAADAQWFDIFNLPNIAFDHREIIDYAIEQLKFRVKYHNIFPNFFKSLDLNKIDLIKKILQK